MTTKMNLNGTTRKALVDAIAEITGEQPVYRKMPTCNYDIGDITVTKDGRIICPDDSDILTTLAEMGFAAEGIDAAGQIDNTGLTICLPRDGFIDSAIDNLRKLVESKASLMRKALGADRLDIEVTENSVSFPWWDILPKSEDTQAYTGFIAALCNMAKDAKRVLAKETEVESEKYAFRCFLLRLGYVGNNSKAARKILLCNLSGHAAFRNKAEEEKFKVNQKAKRDAAKAAQQAAETSEGTNTRYPQHRPGEHV